MAAADDAPSSDEARRDEARSDEARSDEARSDEARRDEARRHEARSFDEIVARLHAEDPGFTAAFHEERPPPARGWTWAGAVFCLAALLMLSFGGVKGAVLAVFPWLIGMACVLKGRG